MTERQAPYGSPLERTLETQLRQLGIDDFEREFRFHPVRKWEADFAWPDEMLIVECEGGTYSQGRHTRGKGFEEDCVKYNAATLLGWRVLRYPKNLISEGKAAFQIQDALGRGRPDEWE